MFILNLMPATWFELAGTGTQGEQLHHRWSYHDWVWKVKQGCDEVQRLYKWFHIHLTHSPNLFEIRVVFIKRSVEASYLFHNHVHSISCCRLLKVKLKIMWKGPLRFFFPFFFFKKKNNAEQKLCKWVSQIIPLSKRTTAVSKDSFFCLKTNNNDVM